jgi:hypothetical protein
MQPCAAQLDKPEAAVVVAALVVEAVLVVDAAVVVRVVVVGTLATHKDW